MPNVTEGVFLLQSRSVNGKELIRDLCNFSIPVKKKRKKKKRTASVPTSDGDVRNGLRTEPEDQPSVHYVLSFAEDVMYWSWLLEERARDQG